jgi:hypothetical protein
VKALCSLLPGGSRRAVPPSSVKLNLHALPGNLRWCDPEGQVACLAPPRAEVRDQDDLVLGLTSTPSGHIRGHLSFGVTPALAINLRLRSSTLE